jgi:molecular chaperone GrpE (heat shock protein)
MQRKGAQKIVNDWKLQITANYKKWLDQLETPPLATSPPKDTHRPDLYSFFEALCVLRSDVSKSSRRSHETFARFGDSLDGFERMIQEISHRLATDRQQSGRMPLSAQKQFLTPFAQMLERMDRLASKLVNPSKAGFFASRRKRAADRTAFKQGFDLLREHFQLLLRDAGIVPMETVGHVFDPTKMKAVAVEHSDTAAHNTVIEELAAGYYLKDVVLKFAEVKIAINKGSHS